MSVIRKTLPLGSVSTGTLRPDDLIPKFLDVADGLTLSREERTTVKRIRRDFESGYQVTRDAFMANVAPETDPDFDLLDNEIAEDKDSDCQDLVDILDDHVPDFCRFGSHEGDGADFGCWIDWDQIADSERDESLFRADSLTARCEPAYFRDRGKQNPQYILEVNDHGNATLYRRAGNRWVEVWSVV